MTKREDFSEIVEIVAKGERSQNRFMWELGDALVRRFGNPQTTGARDGSLAKLEACSAELKAHGYEYEVATLQNLRIAASGFPPMRRRIGVSWATHRDAGSPEILDTIIDGAPTDQKITRVYVREVLRGMALDRQRQLDQETERRRKLAEEASREREAAEARGRRATSAEERRKAAEAAAEAARRQQSYKAPPRMRDVPIQKPKAEDMPILVQRAAFSNELGQIKQALSKLRERYEPLLRTFPEVDVECGHEELMAIAEAARSFADVCRRAIGKGNHLSVVGKDATG